MKNKRFKKVVEWEEGEGKLIFLGVIICLFGLFFFIKGIGIKNLTISLIGLIGFILSFVSILFGLRYGKKVYWREIK